MVLHNLFRVPDLAASPVSNLVVTFADSKSWEVCKAGSTAPPALAAHTLTAVGQHGIFCFGGQGKRVYNAVHKLDPSTCRWELVKTIGVCTYAMQP